MVSDTGQIVLPRNNKLAEIDMHIAALVAQMRHTILVNNSAQMAATMRDIDNRFKKIEALATAYGDAAPSEGGHKFSSMPKERDVHVTKRSHSTAMMPSS